MGAEFLSLLHQGIGPPSRPFHLRRSRVLFPSSTRASRHACSLRSTAWQDVSFPSSSGHRLTLLGESLAVSQGFHSLLHQGIGSRGLIWRTKVLWCFIPFFIRASAHAMPY